MSAGKLETVREYFQAAAEGNRETLSRCLSPSYVWIDHGAGLIARSPEELRIQAEEHRAWSDVRYDIENVVEVTDGSVLVQVLKSGSVNGMWRSMRGNGQRVSYPICEIIRFDADGRIVHEEGYYDLFAIRQQLGYT